MAYISKHNDKWRAAIQQNGQRSSKVFSTKREAQAWATAEESKAKRLKSSYGVTFGDAVERYARDVSSKKKSQKTEALRLATLCKHFGADTPLSEIDSPHIAAWRDARLKIVKSSTVLREVNLLRNLFNVARLEWRWMDQTPFAGVKLPKDAPPRDQLWTWQLIKRVLRAPRIGKTKEMQDAFHIALRTGMRLSEVLRAPENFDKKRVIVELEGSKTEAKAKIPIGRIAAKLLDRPPFTVGPNEGSVLFSKLCRELLITDLTFHDARATGLTSLAAKVDVLTLAKISRHKNLSLLSNVYYRKTAEAISATI